MQPLAERADGITLFYSTIVLISRLGEERREYVKPEREIQKADP